MLPRGFVAVISPQNELGGGNQSSDPQQRQQQSGPLFYMGTRQPKDRLGILRTPLTASIWPTRTCILHRVRRCFKRKLVLRVLTRRSFPRQSARCQRKENKRLNKGGSEASGLKTRSASKIIFPCFIPVTYRSTISGPFSVAACMRNARPVVRATEQLRVSSARGSIKSTAASG
jgi:hypothetical protein